MKTTPWVLAAFSVCALGDGTRAGAQATNRPSPAGLWRATEDSMVVRIASCGDGFCGYAAGIPAPSKSDRKPPACGSQFLFNFVWNERAKRWEGKLRPPDLPRQLNANMQTDGATFLRVNARMRLISKSLHFTPFTSTIREDCQL
jgi:uncharacterized protein (DUF2147 family)